MAIEVKTGVYTYGDEEIAFNFVTDLTMTQKAGLVGSVVDSVVTDEHYHSILRDMIFDMQIVSVMTDVDTAMYIDEDNQIETIEQFLNATNVVEIVKENAAPGLIRSMSDAIDKDIEYKTGIHTNPVGIALASLLQTVESKVDGVDLESMMDMAQSFSDVAGELTPDNMIEAYAKSSAFQDLKNEVLKQKDERAASVIPVDFKKTDEDEAAPPSSSDE